MLTRSLFVLVFVLAALSARAAAPPENGEEGAAPPSEETQDRVEVSPGGLLDVRFHNVDVFQALELLSEQTNRNIVVESGVTGSVSLVLRKVRFNEALDAILSSNNLTHSERGSTVYVRTRPPPPEKEPGSGMTMRVFRLNYISATEAELVVKPLLSNEGKSSKTSDPQGGIATSSENAGGYNPANGDALVVVDYPENIERVAAAVAEIDTQPQQVLVEATIMRATLNDQNALGIDFNTLAGVDFQGLMAVSPGVSNIALGVVPQAQLDNTSIANRTQFTNLVPDGGYTFGLIKNNVAAFIRALEQVTDVTIMANPKVLTLNKQRGQIVVGRRDGYLTTTVTQTAAVQTVQFLETGTRLIFRPFVTRDGFVRMEIHPEDSNGGLTAANLPFQETTEATTNILLRDGHTILIGGLFRERTTASKNQVPLLGSIPGVGKLFGVTSDQSVREEVIILLTVRVLTHNPADDAGFDTLRQDAERVRVGARRGLMGTGREQLAESRYQAAVTKLRAGKPDEALCAVRFALFLNPRHSDAIHMQERLLNERTWNADGSVNRTFMWTCLLRDAGLADGPDFGRPDVDKLLDEEAPQPSPDGETTKEPVE